MKSPYMKTKFVSYNFHQPHVEVDLELCIDLNSFPGYLPSLFGNTNNSNRLLTKKSSDYAFSN